MISPCRRRETKAFRYKVSGYSIGFLLLWRVGNMKIGDRIIGFHLEGTDGGMYTLDSFMEKGIVIIIFYCNHCPYAQAYQDRMIQLQKDYEDDVNIIAINSNDDTQYPEDSLDEMVKRATTYR